MSSAPIHGRRLARAQAMQLLFQAEATGRSVSDVLTGGDYALSDGPLEPFASELALAADAHQTEADDYIKRFSERWDMRRMPSVDRSILRLSVCELLYFPDVDASVTIAEAVVLAKMYGTDNSSGFINALLGNISEAIFEQQVFCSDEFKQAVAAVEKTSELDADEQSTELDTAAQLDKQTDKFNASGTNEKPDEQSTEQTPTNDTPDSQAPVPADDEKEC